MIATTPRLSIEILGHAHADGLFAAFSDPATNRYLVSPEVTTLDALHVRIDHVHRGPTGANDRWLNFAMRHAGTIVGRLEASTYDHNTWAEIAYLVGPAYQRRGFAREGTRWMIDQLRAAGVRDIWAAIHPDNAPSRRLVESLGFVLAEPTRPMGSYDTGDVAYRL